MRPLRWFVPVAALLLLAPLLTGMSGTATQPEPFLRTMVLSPPLSCGPGGAEGCTLLWSAWTFGLPVEEGVTEVRVELVDPHALLLPGVQPVVARLTVASESGGSWEVRVHEGGRSVSGAAYGSARPADEWRFVATTQRVAVEGLPGAHNVLVAEGVKIGLTFAFWGHDIPNDWTLFPEDAGSAVQSQILFKNLDLGTDTVPCASASSIPGPLAATPSSPARTC